MVILSLGPIAATAFLHRIKVYLIWMLLHGILQLYSDLEVWYLQCSIHRVSQEERSIFWEVIVLVILSKKLYVNMCPIPNGFRDRAIWLYSGLAWVPSIVLPSRPAAGGRSMFWETRHVLTRVAKCTDVGSGIFKHLL
jgi:hypothetical protein